MLVIGICGASGSGKTTLAEELMARLPGRAVLIHQDSYYKDHSGLSMEDRALINYDHPDIYDHDLLYEDLRALTQGRPILEKGYNFAQHRREDPLTPIAPGDVLIFESEDRGYLKTVERFESIPDAIAELEAIRDLG